MNYNVSHVTADMGVLDYFRVGFFERDTNSPHWELASIFFSVLLFYQVLHFHPSYPTPFASCALSCFQCAVLLAVHPETSWFSLLCNVKFVCN